VTPRNSFEGGAFNLWWIYKEPVMKKVLLLLVAILAGNSLALGQAATMPAVQTPVKVLVVPFTQIGETGGHEWVGAAIQESLLTDASLDTAVQATAMDRPLAKDDLSQATVAAKGTGATLVVFGGYQYTSDQLRVTGRVVDVNYGRVLGTLKATGAVIDLFKIEDALSSQFQAILPQPPGNSPVVTYGPNQADVPTYSGNSQAAVDQPQQTYVYQSPPVDTEPDYGYSYPLYDNPYYYGGSPLYYGGGWGWGYERPFYQH